MDFPEKVFDYLKGKTEVQKKEDDFGSSAFPLLYIHSKNLYIHLISLDQRIDDLKTNTLQKMSLAYLNEQKNIIHLFEDQYLHQEQQIQMRLSSILDLNERIHARLCTIKRIDKEAYEKFLENAHLLQHANSKFKYGMFIENELMAVMGISAGRWMNKEGHLRKSFEIIRFATMPMYTIVGGFTKFLKHVESELEVDEWMTYMDLDWAIQGVYQMLDFEVKSVRAAQVYYIHKDSLIRYKEKEVIDSELKNNYFTIHTAGSIKLIKKVK